MHRNSIHIITYKHHRHFFPHLVWVCIVCLIKQELYETIQTFTIIFIFIIYGKVHLGHPVCSPFRTNSMYHEWLRACDHMITFILPSALDLSVDRESSLSTDWISGARVSMASRPCSSRSATALTTTACRSSTLGLLAASFTCSQTHVPGRRPRGYSCCFTARWASDSRRDRRL